MFSISQFFFTSEYLCEIVLHFSNQINGHPMVLRASHLATIYYNLFKLFSYYWYGLSAFGLTYWLNLQDSYFDIGYLFLTIPFKGAKLESYKISYFLPNSSFWLGKRKWEYIYIFPLILLFNLGNTNEDMVSITLENRLILDSYGEFLDNEATHISH